MAVDYSKFKTPFFEISVSDSTGKRMVPLPHHISRLISKVEIVETWEQNSFNTINITFIEGSREPASPDATLGTDGLYKIAAFETGESDMDVAGSLTNRTGIITDLRFSGSGGITFVTNNEKRKQSIDTSTQKNINKELTTRSYPNESKRPVFLFQERNQIRVKWGYKEDLDTVRTMRSYIMMVSVKYPESGQVETTVMCQDTSAALDQIAAVKGVPFGKRVTTSKGNSITEFVDRTTEETIRDICNSAGLPCVVSTNLPVPTLDTDHQKVWLAGESFTQFMWRLAKQNNCYFKVIPNPQTGIDTLMFVKKSDFERRVLVDRQLLTYKAPGSILKSAEIKVDFGGLQGNTQTGITKDGANPTVNSESPGEKVTVHMIEGKTPKMVDVKPTGSANSVKAADGVAKIAGEVTGKVEITPENDLNNRSNSADVNQEDQSRVINLDFSTIGYTKLTPGTVEIFGLGVRYSGKYRVMTTTHTITAESYDTKCTAVSMALAAGGQLNPKALIEEQEEQKEQVSVKMFKAEEQRTNSDEVQKGLDKNLDRK